MGRRRRNKNILIVARQSWRRYFFLVYRWLLLSASLEAHKRLLPPVLTILAMIKSIVKLIIKSVKPYVSPKAVGDLYQFFIGLKLNTLFCVMVFLLTKKE